MFGRERVAVTGSRPGVAAVRSPRFPLEVAAVWSLFAVVAVEVLVTYSRLPAEELYHVSGSGLTGGASRALVFFNFPLALVAIPILALLADRLPGRSLKVVALAGIALSAVIFWPGVVTQSNLDARPVNAIAAVGVLVAVVLTVVAAARLARPARPARQPGDLLRLVVAVTTLGLALPWIGADLGVFFSGVPVRGTLYQTGELRSQPGVAGVHTAVHHGHHHGMDGTLLVLAALLLSRLVVSVRRGWLAGVLGAYLALVFCYGAGNIANDFWLEQVTKRGWTSWEVPDVTTPKASPAWGVVVAAAVVIFGVSVWRARRSGAPWTSAPQAGSRTTPTSARVPS